MLISLGALFLAVQLVPGLRELMAIEFSWPLLIIGLGVFLFVLGLLVGAPDMAIPATIVSGIGGLLFWQNSTGNWESWAYAWTLIPGFVGLGMILAGLIGGNLRQRFGGGMALILISALMFAVFGSILGVPFALGSYWPVLLIALGLLILFRPLLRS